LRVSRQEKQAVFGSKKSRKINHLILSCLEKPINRRIVIMNKFKFGKVASLLLFVSTSVLAQMPSVSVPVEEVAEQEDFTWWYVTLLVLAVALAGAVFWWLNSRKVKKAATVKSKKNESKNKWEEDSLDADKELEWLRKNQKIINKRGKKHGSGQKLPNRLPKPSNVFERSNGEVEEVKLEVEAMSSGVLPVFSIQRLELARPFSPLSLSNDEALMSAIEQVQDEYEEDEEVRDLSLRVLAAFKTRNAVEALSQIALYDLSSNLRSKAATTLADIDHESVFEPILLACADPTREVRAAAARGLFRLSFDRADAWTRIAETNDEFKMRASARAAIEADLVKRSFERLVHTDFKSAYEAFTLVALLLRAGETKEVFEALMSHRDMNVRKAVLHCIKITKEPNALEGLYSLLEKASLPEELQREVDETIQEISFVMA
jgi:HEAT repeats